MTNFEIYYLVGVIVSLYMIWFYIIKSKREPAKIFQENGEVNLVLLVLAPLIWPLQIIKHIYDLYKKKVKY
jgi:hypothetical protein